jgi:hypothetical protein
MTGAQGFATNTGAQGTQGPQGFTGFAGFAVWTGAQGVQGTQGVTGAQGAQGVTGIQGAQGTQGTQGVTGAQGIAGAATNTGAQGVAGSATNTGAQGVQGATGPVSVTNQNPFSGFTADYNNVYYRQSTSTLNYITGFITPAANFALSTGYVGQQLTIQSSAAVSVTGLFLDSSAALPGTTGGTLSMTAANATASLIFNGTRWVLLYRSAGVSVTA